MVADIPKKGPASCPVLRYARLLVEGPSSPSRQSREQFASLCVPRGCKVPRTDRCRGRRHKNAELLARAAQRQFHHSEQNQSLHFSARLLMCDSAQPQVPVPLKSDQSAFQSPMSLFQKESSCEYRQHLVVPQLVDGNIGRAAFACTQDRPESYPLFLVWP